MQGPTLRPSRISARLRALAQLPPTGPVVSCYLDTDGRRRPRPADLAQAAEQVARQARAEAGRLGLGRDGLLQVEAGLDAFRRAVDGLGRRGTTKGLAVFAHPGGAEEVRLPTTLPDRGVVGQRPFLLPLGVAVAEHPPLGLVLSDRERARLALYHLGELEELGELVDEVPARTSGGGWAQARLARRSDEAARHHVKRTAAAAWKAFRAVDGIEPVLAGPEPAVSELAACLHPELAGRVRTRLRLPVSAPGAELARALGEVAAARAEERRRELVEQVCGGALPAALGLDPFLAALRERRVAAAVAVEGATSPGAACPRCGTLSLAPACPLCLAATHPLGDVVEPALEEALRQGATVVLAPADGSLARHQVGALLRY